MARGALDASRERPVESRRPETVQVVCLVQHLRRCDAVEGQDALLLVLEMTMEQCAALRGTLEDLARASSSQQKEDV
jgi:hypothetical protein